MTHLVIVGFGGGKDQPRPVVLLRVHHRARQFTEPDLDRVAELMEDR